MRVGLVGAALAARSTAGDLATIGARGGVYGEIATIGAEVGVWSVVVGVAAVGLATVGAGGAHHRAAAMMSTFPAHHVFA